MLSSNLIRASWRSPRVRPQASWRLFRSYTNTNTDTFTVPYSGWYRIHCIGRGGDGGNGGTNYWSSYTDESGNSCIIGYPGGLGSGGGSGGYTQKIVYLYKDSQYPISVDDSLSKFGQDTNCYLYAHAGSPGVNGKNANRYGVGRYYAGGMGGPKALIADCDVIRAGNQGQPLMPMSGQYAGYAYGETIPSGTPFGGGSTSIPEGIIVSTSYGAGGAGGIRSGGAGSPGVLGAVLIDRGF